MSLKMIRLSLSCFQTNSKSWILRSLMIQNYLNLMILRSSMMIRWSLTILNCSNLILSWNLKIQKTQKNCLKKIRWNSKMTAKSCWTRTSLTIQKSCWILMSSKNFSRSLNSKTQMSCLKILNYYSKMRRNSKKIPMNYLNLTHSSLRRIRWNCLTQMSSMKIDLNCWSSQKSCLKTTQSCSSLIH